MTADTHIDDESAADLPATDRYVALCKDDGSVIIYDSANSQAWIQSDASATIERMI